MCTPIHRKTDAVVEHRQKDDVSRFSTRRPECGHPRRFTPLYSRRLEETPIVLNAVALLGVGEHPGAWETTGTKRMRWREKLMPASFSPVAAMLRLQKQVRWHALLGGKPARPPRGKAALSIRQQQWTSGRMLRHDSAPWYRNIGSVFQLANLRSYHISANVRAQLGTRAY